MHVERELVGGECSYCGCIPSKTLLRPVTCWPRPGGCRGWAEVRPWDNRTATAAEEVPTRLLVLCGGASA